MAREFFRFGSGSKNFTRHNGKILVRESQKTRTAFRPIPEPNS
nr:hypothetical protein [Porphyromonas gingivalis]